MDLPGALMLLVVWGFFAVISGIVASSMGRSRIAWFVLGLVFGPLSFLALGVVPAVRPGLDDRPPSGTADETQQRWPR